MKKIVKVGSIGVDAGLCWIGDPCYIMHKETPPKAIGSNWGGFCNIIDGNRPTMKSFDFDLGHEGLGVCVSTGFGDGCYPVYAVVEDTKKYGKRVMAAYVDFGAGKKMFDKLMERK